MTKFLLLLVTLWAVIHRGYTSTVNRTEVIDPKISFIDSSDDSDSIREKIRTEMDNYKRLKEIALKNKLLNSTTTTTTETSSAPTTTLSALMTSEMSSPDPDSTTAISSSTATTSSSTTEISTPATELSSSTTELTTSEQTTLAASTTTIRRIVLGDLEVEESPDDPDYIDTTMAPSENNSNGIEVDDRFILNAPTICAEGRVPVNGKCRKVIS